MADDKTQIWNLVLKDMEKAVSKANFFLLFKQTRLIALDDGIATIASPSTMACDLLQKRFQAVIKESLDTHHPGDNSLLFITKAPVTEVKEEAAGSLFSSVEKPADVVKPLSAIIGHLPRVRSEFTFENLAVSGSNQLAFTAAQTVVRSIGTAYNPLFIYGPVGVGKTHLMHAIANEVYQKQPDKKIIYITSEEFTNEVIDAIRTNDTTRMKKRFRSALLLLIDDIQFIEGKERVQEELFHTFNILIDQGSQIALSSDRPPQEIKKLEKRLSSRFAGGLTVDIDNPDTELKTAILQKKAQKYNLELPTDVALLLAEKVEDVRSLEGLLLRVITMATTRNEDVTIELANRVLGLKGDEPAGPLHTEDVIKSVCNFYSIKPTQLKGPKRDASLVRARQVAMYLLKTQLQLTLVEIGNVLGGRDHTTVMHGVEKIETLRENNVHISEDIRGITRSLRG